MAKDKIIIAGRYNEKFNNILELSLPIADIHIYPGLEKHIRKKHEDCSSYFGKIPEIISSPDYIGKHPKIENSIELIKVFEENILISINLDVDNGYLYVSSLYDVKQSKIERRLNSGRLIKYE